MGDIFQEGTFLEKVRDSSVDGLAMEQYADGEEITIRFIPVKEISYKQSNGFGAYLCELEQDNEDVVNTFNISGVFVRNLDLGQTYESTGIISTYRGTKQFKVNDIKKIMPHNKRGIITFLKSLNGIGFLADVIYDEYGDESLNVIKNNPLELIKLSPTLYEEKVLDWKKQIDELKDDYDYMIRLMNLGLKSYQAKELYDIYGDTIFIKLEENPYFLAKDIKGYSFLKCDEMAQKIGIHPENTQRLCEGIMYKINSLGANGDTYFDYDFFFKYMKKELSIRVGILEMKRLYKTIKGNNPIIYKYGKISFQIEQQALFQAMSDYQNARYQKEKDEAKLMVFEISDDKLKEAINILILEDRLFIDNNRVYKKDVYKQELAIANSLSNIIKYAKPNDEIDIDKMIDNYLSSTGIELEERQRLAVKTIASEQGGITIIDGSAGCGKTFTMKIALAIIEKIYIYKTGYFQKIIIAPTGKASKVAQKATGIPAFTVHRALKYHPNLGYEFNSSNMLPYDCIIIDEASMLDTELAYRLFSAVAPYTKLIIMGDTKQLPSIGAGNVLRDLIDCKKINNVTLNVVKRQGVDSGIIKNARSIIDGDMITSQKENMDALIYGCDTYDKAHEKLFKLFNTLLKKYALEEIQVLSPQKTGVCGTNYLNFLLQEKLNPDNNDIRFLNKTITVNIDGKNNYFDLYFKRGDRVINMRNNYTIPWYKNVGGTLVPDESNAGITNGEVGTIVKLIETKTDYNEYNQQIIVQYDDKYIIYENDFSDIEHSYALTIHKSQGSEWKAVILMLINANPLMLDRNLLYTGYTRAKEFIATITDSSTLQKSIRNQKSIYRNTGLKDKLIEYIN